jgi:hypothetical protein
MTDQDFARLAYREGHAANIREALLASIKAGERTGEAHNALVCHIRRKPAPSMAEKNWLRRYDAAVLAVLL